MTGLELASRTIACSGAGNVVFTLALWPLPPLGVALAGPELAVTMRRLVGGAGGVGAVPCGMTNRVMLWGGRVFVSRLPETDVSARRVIALLDVKRHTCTGPPAEKFDSRTFTGVVVVRSLLIAITVSAPAVRWAANTDSASGLGATADTLVSPKAPPWLS